MSEQGTPDAPAGSPAPETKPEQKPGSMEIKIKDQNENETVFKIKHTTKLSKVFDAYCDRASLTRNTVRFLFEGHRIQEDSTPEGLEMEDGDMIEAMLEQVGGEGTAEPEPETRAPAAEGEKPEKPGAINIRVKDQNEGETVFKIKGHTKLGKVFDAYCDRMGFNRNTVRFLFDGTRIQDNDTPDSLEMQDDDMVQAMIEQVGGDGGAADDEAGAAAAEEQKPEGGSEHISVQVKDQAGQELHFKIKRSTPFRKVMAAYCTRQGIDMKAVRFLFDGDRLQEDETPAIKEMEEGDCIDVFSEQLGGAAEDDAEAEGAPKPEAQRLTLSVLGLTGDSVEFKCKTTTPLAKLINAYCQQKELKPDTLRFFTPTGKRIVEGATANSMDLEDGDVIEVQMQQTGGGD